MSKARRKPLLIILILIALFLIITLIVIEIDNVGEIRDWPTALGSGAIFQFDAAREFVTYWYNYEFEDVKTAVTTYFEVYVTPDNFQEIMRFEEGSYSFVFVPGYTGGTFFGPRTPTLYSFMFMERSNKMLTPVYMWAHGIEALAYDTRGVWYDEDRVARDIVMSYVQEEMTSRVNGGIPLYYGVGVGNPPNYISVLGQEPDGIVPFEFSGETYFFWYFTSPTQFGEPLSGNVDISTHFMLAEVIDLLDIRVIR